MSEVTVSMKLTPKQAGALYVKAMRLEDEVKKQKADRESMASEINQLKLKAADRDKLQDELIDMMNQRDAALAQLAAIQDESADSGTWLKDSNVNGGKRQGGE